MGMKVFKFGGASVNSAAAVKNVAAIIRSFATAEIVVVFSAMGKTTNALEALVQSALYARNDFDKNLNIIRTFHQDIIDELFEDPHHPVHYLLDGLMNNLNDYCQKRDLDFDEFYDRIVPFGELISTAIISAWFDHIDLKNILLPAPALIKTDARFRDASVDWSLSAGLIVKNVNQAFAENPGHIIISQGFIASTSDGRRTTLGREGSDFSAAIFAWCLDAESLTVWKDVDGLLNADPVYFADTQKIEELSYKEAIELAFYGAKILHPKTIKPLQNKNIPLLIKSFTKPDLPGSIIQSSEQSDHLVPFLIYKSDQILLSFSTRDFSFVTEEKLYRLFGIFNQYHIKINLMQNSAISFTVCINDPGDSLHAIISLLSDAFEIRYNRDMHLLTIRHFNQQVIDRHLSGRKIYLEQRSRTTLMIAYR
jgi:aspartate kinase